MRPLLIGLTTALVCFVSLAKADPQRHALSGPPRTARGVIERIIVFHKQVMLQHGEGVLEGVVALQGGVLMPVSEDRDGIYYQAPNGVWVFDRNHFSTTSLPGILFPGGLCFSKTRPDDVYAYTGDARKQNQYLDKDRRPIAPDALAALKIGHVAKGNTRK